MESKTSIREKRSAISWAQKILLDHIRIVAGYKRWGIDITKDESIVGRPCEIIDIPTYGDYEAIRDALLKNELQLFTGSSKEIYFIPVPNVFLGLKGKKKVLLTRPEDQYRDPKELPAARCLVVHKGVLENKSDLDKVRFKSRADFKRFLIHVRAILLGLPLRGAISKRGHEQTEKWGYEYHLKKSKDYAKEHKTRLIRRYRQQTDHKSSNRKGITPRQWLIRNFFEGSSESYKKIRQRLIKEKLAF